MQKEKKKILFSAYSLDVGGIETALINLLNYLAKTDKYNITLVLEKKQGIFLQQLDNSIEVIEYTPSYIKIIGKFINIMKRIKFILKYKNKFDASFAYATYCKMASFTAQMASNNSNLWVHSSYYEMYNKDKEQYKKFFEELNYNKFNNILFVSNRCKEEFENIMKKNNLVVCKNIIDYKKIIKLSEEEVNYNKENIFTILYVGRLTEKSKKVSRLFEIAEYLKNKSLNFKIIVIGGGEDLEKYKKDVKQKKLEKYINFIGEKSNPYPYFKKVDALILVSDNEGYPVVYNEAQVLNLPIITTDVSDSKLDIENKYGVVCEQDITKIEQTVEDIIENGFDKYIFNKQQFDAEKYNKEIYIKIEKIINNDERK